MPACSEERPFEIEHVFPKIAIKPIEIRHQKGTAMRESVHVLPVIRSIIAGILPRRFIVNKAFARNGAAEVCANLLLELGPVPFELLSGSGLAFMFNMMLLIPPLIATKINAAPKSGTDKRTRSRPLAHFVRLLIMRFQWCSSRGGSPGP
jgi:hypothetical protein